MRYTTRYADALLQLADQQKSLEVVRADCETLGQALDHHDNLRKFIQNPLLPRQVRAKALKDVGESLGLSALVLNFIQVIAINGRAHNLELILKAVEALAEERSGIVRAEVITAKALSKAVRSELEETLQRSIKAKIKLQETEDPTLLGGAVVKVGSLMVDTSIRSRLQKLALALKGA